jgi:hypothetical protein
VISAFSRSIGGGDLPLIRRELASEAELVGLRVKNKCGLVLS